MCIRDRRGTWGVRRSSYNAGAQRCFQAGLCPHLRRESPRSAVRTAQKGRTFFWQGRVDAHARADLETGRGVQPRHDGEIPVRVVAVSYTHLRAHETVLDLVCRLLLEKKQRTVYEYVSLIIK